MSVLRGHRTREDDRREEYAEGAVEGQRNGYHLSEEVEWVRVEHRSGHSNVDTDAGEDCGKQIRSGSESCFQVQEECATKEDEDADNDGRRAFDILCRLDSVKAGVWINVGASQVGEINA